MALYLQKTLRKREVQLSRISVYIVVIIVTCHTIRIVPNTWEIVQTFNGENQEVIDLYSEDNTLCHNFFANTLIFAGHPMAPLGGHGDRHLPPGPHHLLLPQLLHLLWEVWST